jgi:hypothetical protein
MLVLLSHRCAWTLRAGLDTRLKVLLPLSRIIVLGAAINVGIILVLD